MGSSCVAPSMSWAIGLKKALAPRFPAPISAQLSHPNHSVMWLILGHPVALD